jgi:hypothetical protein
MSKELYLPRGDKQREAWLKNFAAEFASVALALGFTQAEIDEVKNFAAAYVYVLYVMNIYKSEAHEWTTYKDLLAEGVIGSHLGGFPEMPVMPAAPVAVGAGMLKKVAKIVQRVKNHPDYDESIGDALRIIGAEVVIDYLNLKVRITLRQTDNDGVALDFVKGQMDGVVVYGGVFTQKVAQPTDPPATTDVPPVMKWTEIGRANKSPYVDRRLNEGDLPETRYYKMKYMKDDETVGKDSDTISVIAVVFRAGNETATKLK